MRVSVALALAGSDAVAVGGCTTSGNNAAVDQNNLTLNNTYQGSGVPAIEYNFCTSPNGSTPSNCCSYTLRKTWEGVIGCPQPINHCQITVAVNRRWSASVAQWFDAQNSVVTCTNNRGSTPNDLNFAFLGTLAIGKDSYPVAQGQGSPSAGIKNWGFGGPGWALQDGATHTLRVPLTASTTCRQVRTTPSTSASSANRPGASGPALPLFGHPPIQHWPSATFASPEECR